jgi:hypothetical protein
MMIELNEFDRLKMQETINMNISVSLMKIKNMLTETLSEPIAQFPYELSVISHESR